MSELGYSVLHRTRELGFRSFHRFGIHCATHQIRVILICGVVITSLFYPALASYSSSQPQFIAHYSSRLLDSFRSVEGSGYYGDVSNIWTGHGSLHIREDSVSRARCGVERTVRVERVLTHNPMMDDTGSLNPPILLSTLMLETRISKLLTSRGISCVRKQDGECLVISPSAFWNYDGHAMLSDPDVSNTLDLIKNTSLAGIPVKPQMVLAGRELDEYTPSKVGYASALVLTYFFLEIDCLEASGHASWLNALQDAVADDAELIPQVQEPTLIALQHSKNVLKRTGSGVVSAVLYIAYFMFLLYFALSIQKVTTVHSCFGLTLTGVVEMMVSTITSLSVCALVGFKVTMVPWAIIPIVILFVGAESMFNLVDAVVKTSVTLPVKERIAEGLSKAGTSNTLKVVSYNATLGVIAFFSAGAIRQFCAFAVVVLVAHWFLVHTFFITVLSIDIQRLELDELIRQNSTLAPAEPAPSRTLVSPNTTPWGKTLMAINNLLRHRATKNLSLVLLLAVTATLYYATYPSSISREEPRRIFPDSVARAKSAAAGIERQSPAWNIWHILNPADDPLVHLRIESPTIVIFRPDGSGDHGQELRPYRSRFSTRTLRPVMWILNIVVLPIAVTTSTLYGLLLYLLKDADLLEAQRNRAGPEVPDVEEELPVEPEISFTTLPRAFSTDVELIAASKDGRVVVSVGLDNGLVVWQTGREDPIRVDATDILLRSACTSSAVSALTALAVDDKGEYCAVGTGAGAIAIWSIQRGKVLPLPHLVRESLSSAVIDLEFVSRTRGKHSGSPIGVDSANVDTTPYLVSIHDNCVAVKWIVDSDSTFGATYVSPSGRTSVSKCTLVRFQTPDPPLVVFCLEDGLLELHDMAGSGSLAGSERSFKAGNPADLVSRVHACYLDLNGERRLIVAAGTYAGVVSLWDGSPGECISILDDAYGEINNLRVSPVRRKICPLCGELPPESFFVSFSVGHVVVFHRVYASAEGRRCSCPRTPNSQTSSRHIIPGRRSRSSSQASSGGSASPFSFSNMRSRMPSVGDGVSSDCFLGAALFPVSGHGHHLRRTLEKRSSDPLSATLDGDEDGLSHPIGPVDSQSSSSADKSPLWQNALVVRTADTTVERGGWDIANGHIVGVRRKARTAVKAKDRPRARIESRSSVGLTPATLERWELWTLESSAARVRVSPLAALERGAGGSAPRSPVHSAASNTDLKRDGRHIAGLPFTRVSSVVGGRSFCLAGFGNTVGIFHFSASDQLN